jgi:superfamily II DNA or RNA helicase/HKD family nuclease
MDDALFVVDNSADNWKAENYLMEWCEIARQFDIATGYFDIAALLTMKEKWQKLDKIRILMGDEISLRTKNAFDNAINDKKAYLDASIETEKEENDFLEGVEAIVAAIRSKKIECRVYKKKKFHAKAYITYERIAVRPPVALVGSSNFTKNGLSSNIELNVQIDSSAEVKILQKWYEKHWDEAVDVSVDILKVIERHLYEFTPFDVYAKSLQEYFRGHEETITEWECSKSIMYAEISQYQKEAYHSLMKIAKQWKGAFLCDGVGLGKTFVGLMLLERLVHDKKNVVLLVPKSGRTAVWEENIQEFLPDLLHNPYVSLTIYNHTDLLRDKNPVKDFPAEFEHIRKQADVFIIDEGHNFRNHTSNRYKKLFSLMDGGKQLFILTATPINNSLFDLKDQMDLFTQNDDKYFSAAPLGIHSLRGYFIKREKALRVVAGDEDSSISDDKAKAILNSDELFRTIVVQRSREYVKKSLAQEDSDKEVLFPVREDPQVAAYSLKKIYGGLLKEVTKAFDKKKPLLQLPLYSLYDTDPKTDEYIYYIGNPDDVDSMAKGRQVQVVALIRVLLLKRLESSVVSFRETCENLILKLYSFIELHDDKSSTRWRNQHEDILKSIRENREGDWNEDTDDDVIPDELKFDWERLDPTQFDISKLIMDTILDLDQLIDFLDEIIDFDYAKDDKVKVLIELLQNDKDLKNEKLIIFTEYQATARYLEESIVSKGFKNVFRIDSTTKTDRNLIMKRFAPFYNKTTPVKLKEERGFDQIRILIATDVLSEGVNLQDARLILNYDIHWNPVRLMQRIGRVDRRMDPNIEAQIINYYPDLEDKRGKARFWNFLPPDELNDILSLYNRVTHKTLRISKVFGIEGKRLLRPEDDYDALKDFNHSYEGETSNYEEMHLLYQRLLKDIPGLQERLSKMPRRVFSGKEKITSGALGVFLCYKLPSLIRDGKNEFWSIAEGSTQWFLYDIEKSEIISDPMAIDIQICSDQNTNRVVRMDQIILVDIRKKIEADINRNYIRRNQVPLQDENGNSLKPQLIAWMELN